MKNRMVGIMAMMLFFTAGLSQTVDSVSRHKLLLARYDTSYDTVQINVLLSKAKAMLNMQPDSVLQQMQWAIELADRNRLDAKKAECLSLLGKALYILGEYNQALPNFVNALHLYEENRDHFGQATSLNNIGLIYQTRKMYEEAIHYHHQAAVQAKLINNDERLGAIFFNIALAYDESGRYDSALRYTALASQYSRKANDQRVIAMSDNRFGEIYFDLKEYAKAEYHYNEALTNTRFESDWEKCFSLSGLAQTYAATGQLDKALKMGLESYALARKMKTKWELMRIALILSKIYALQHRYDKAYELSMQHKSYADSVYNEQRDSDMNFILLKQNEIEKLQLEEERARNLNQLKQKNLQIVMAILAGVLLLVIASVFYARHRYNKRMNKTLAEANARMEHQNTELERLNQTMSQLFTIITHDMRSPFISLHGLLGLAKDGDLDAQAQKHFLLEIQQALNAITGSMESLLRWANSQIKGIKNNPVKVGVDHVVEESIALWKTTLQDKHVAIVHTPMNYAVHADADQLKTILRNLIGNAIKFSHLSGTIRVYYTKESEQIGIHVEDNGIGMSEEIIASLFEFRRENQQRGTAKESGTGIGLMISKQFAEQNGGTITVHSEKDKGSRFSVWLREA